MGLVPRTRKLRAYGYYQSGYRPHIHICSRPASLEFRLRSRKKRRQFEHFYRIALYCGLRIERKNDVWLGRWDADGLRRFIIEYLLLHEIGHHVYDLGRPWYQHPASELNHERFAIAYAHRQQQRLARAEGRLWRLASPPRYRFLPGYDSRGGKSRWRA